MGREDLDVPRVRPLRPGPRTGRSPCLWRGNHRHGVTERDLALHLSLSPAGLGPIHLSAVRCRGYEQTLSDCPSLEGSQNGCRHENDAAVRCNVPNMGFGNQVSSDLAVASGRGGWEGLREPQDTWSQGAGGSRGQSGKPSPRSPLAWAEGSGLRRRPVVAGTPEVDALSHHSLSGPR